MYKIIVYLLFIVNINLFAVEIDIHNILSLDIPDNIEILSIRQTISHHNKSDQYCLGLYLETVYENKFIPLKIELFGYQNFDMIEPILSEYKSRDYFPEYKTASQIDYLKENYKDNFEFTDSQIKVSRLVTDWSNGWTKDYYGIYLKLNNYIFQEGIISMINIWDAFGGTDLKSNDLKYRSKLTTLNNPGQIFFSELDQLLASITEQPNINELILNTNIEQKNYEQIDDLYLPTIEDLRLRTSPKLNSEIIGYVPKAPLRIIGRGPSMTIDGINGEWLRIKTVIGSTIGWAFSGYLRKMTSDEEASFFEGI